MAGMTKLTRRELAAVALGTAAAPAQEKPQAPPEDELSAARKQVESNAAALAKFDLPMSTEPAFLFKP